MDENKSNAEKDLSTDRLKQRVQAGLERQKDAVQTVREEAQPRVKQEEEKDYSLKKDENPYEQMSIDELAGQFLSEEDMKYLSIAEDTPNEGGQISENGEQASATEALSSDKDAPDGQNTKQTGVDTEMSEAVNADNGDGSQANPENISDEDDDGNIPAYFAANEALDDEDEGGIKNIIDEDEDGDMGEIKQLVNIENRSSDKKKKKKKPQKEPKESFEGELLEYEDESGQQRQLEQLSGDVQSSGQLKRGGEKLDIKKRMKGEGESGEKKNKIAAPGGKTEVKPDEKAYDDAAVDDTDLKLMMAFGMDDELEKTASVDKITQINEAIGHDEIDEKGAKKVKKETPLPEFNKKREEYTSIGQINGIFSDFKHEYNILLMRMLGALVLLIISFFYENIGIFGGSLPAAVDMAIFPVVHVMLDIQMIALACALIPRQIINGTVQMFKLKPIPESLTALIVMLSLLYELPACFAKTGSTLKMYGFTVIFCIFLNLLYEFFNLKREILNFNIVASKRVKYAISQIDDEEAKLEKAAFSDTLPENPELFSICKTSFIDGFFAKQGNGSKNRRLFNILVPLTLGIFLIFFVAGLIYTKQFYSAMSQGYVSALFTMPFSVFITYSYPFFHAENEAYSVDSTIIGEESLEKYSKANVISFEDKDVFPSYGVKVKHVTAYGENRFDYIIYNAASVFITIGGPLSDVFEVVTRDLGHSDDVEIVHVENNGIEAIVDGAHIYLGKAPYIRSNGFQLPRDSNSTDEESSGEICVMYMTLGDELAAKMYVQYVIDPDFEPLLKQLYKTGVCVGIKTFDPNINDQMLSTRIRISKYPVKIIKVESKRDKPEVEPHIDSGIVSKSSAKSLLQTLSLCERVTNATKNALIVKIFSIAVSIIVAVLIMIFGSSTGVHSFYLALYQLFWIVPIILLTKISIGKI